MTAPRQPVGGTPGESPIIYPTSRPTHVPDTSIMSKTTDSAAHYDEAVAQFFEELNYDSNRRAPAHTGAKIILVPEKFYDFFLTKPVLVALVAGLISGTVCFDCFYNFHKNQFINGVVYGFLIVLILIIIEICITCDFSKIWSLIVAFLGAISFFLVAIFILEYVAGYPRFANRLIYLRLLIAGLLCLALTAIFILNIYFLIKREADCNYPCNC